MELTWQALRNRYDQAMAAADPRTDHWLMVGKPWPMLTVVAVYLLFVYFAPKYMKNKRPFDLKPIMIAYNFALVLLCAFTVYEIIVSVMQLNYSFAGCNKVEYSTEKNLLRLASALWWFYFSKIIELLDTVIFILRKKNSQVSFLHVYHHSTMICLWWIGVKWYAGGSSYPSAMVNSSMHVVMYSYYFLSALGESIRKYLWWKKYLTSLQLAQFVFLLVHVSYSFFIECDFDIRPRIALVIYLLSHIALFSNFFHKQYVVKGEKKKD